MMSQAVTPEPSFQGLRTRLEEPDALAVARLVCFSLRGL